MMNENFLLNVNYNQVGQELFGGGLDSGGQHSHSLDGLFTLETTLKDPVANDHQ
jgi:hypothetical protein